MSREQPEEYLLAAFHFLVTDFGYRDIGRLPAAVADVDIRAFLNRAAGLQIEFSGRSFGSSFHCELRRLIGSEPTPWTDAENHLSYQDIALVQDPRHWHELNHNYLGWHGVVDATARLLRGNPDLLTGRTWIPRSKVERAWSKYHRRTFGFSLDYDGPTVLDQVRSVFAFLIELGYVLTFDSDRLSPHESGLGRLLRYEKGESVVEIEDPDIRESVWSIRLNGKPIGESHYVDHAELEASAGLLAKRLGAGAVGGAS